MTDTESGLDGFAAMTSDELLTRAEDLRRQIDCLRYELDDVESELDGRDAAEEPETDRTAA